MMSYRPLKSIFLLFFCVSGSGLLASEIFRKRPVPIEDCFRELQAVGHQPGRDIRGKQLSNDRIVVEVVRESDFEDAQIVFDDPHVRETFGHFRVENEITSWSSPAAEAGVGAYFVIREAVTNEVVGLSYFYDVHLDNFQDPHRIKVARVGTAIREKFNSTGYATEAEHLIHNLILQDLKFNHLIARVDPRHKQMIRNLKQKGFVATAFRDSEAPDRPYYAYPAFDPELPHRIRLAGGIRKFEGREIQLDSTKLNHAMNTRIENLKAELEARRLEWSDENITQALFEHFSRQSEITPHPSGTDATRRVFDMLSRLVKHPNVDQRSLLEYLLILEGTGNLILDEVWRRLESELQETIGSLELIEQRGFSNWMIELSREYRAYYEETLLPSFDFVIWDLSVPAIVHAVEVKQLQKPSLQKPADIGSLIQQAVRKLKGPQQSGILQNASLELKLVVAWPPERSRVAAGWLLIDNEGKVILELKDGRHVHRPNFFEQLRLYLNKFPDLILFDRVVLRDHNGKTITQFLRNPAQPAPNRYRWIEIR